MNISLTNDDAVKGVIRMQIDKNDYSSQVEKQLKQYRQKASIPGFRKGMVPIGMIKKLYGKYVIVEEVNRCVSENLYKYLQENNIRILGEPMPNETEQQPIDFDTQEEFEFLFDVALAPKLEIKLTKRDKLTEYKILVSEDDIDKEVETFRRNYGTYDPADEVAEEDLLKGVVSELDENKNPKEGGILVTDAVLMAKYIKGKREQTKFIGAKTGDVVVFNPDKAFKGAAAEIASLLKIDKTQAEGLKSDFRFEIKEITRYKPAELNQAFYDSIYGEGAVDGDEGFRQKLAATIEERYRADAEFIFGRDVRNLLKKKAGDVQFADDILKRWLLTAGKDNTQEKVDEDYPHVVEDLKYHLAKDYVITTNNITTEYADIVAAGGDYVKAYYAQYGAYNLPDDFVEKQVSEMMGKKETLDKFTDAALDKKLTEFVKEHVKIEPVETSYDEFMKLLA
ncbi:MAG: trigger factor [Tannerella sp.]|jgi:trigger factor|nr:trigger factor [Tannerella sp.]